MYSPPSPDVASIAKRLKDDVLGGIRSAFVAKEEVIDVLGVSLVAGENLFILGPPGTAKSALVHALGQRLHGETFAYLLTRFTEPNELFGPFDIRRLREGDLITNTEGMLTEATLVFLDELLNANSAILNSLLTVLNERVLHRGRERLPVKSLTFVGASNHLPEDDALRALFDRFLLRVKCEAAPDERLLEVLDAGWKLESSSVTSSLQAEEVRQLQKAVSSVSLQGVLKEYVELVQRIRHAGITFSDRRAVKAQRLIASSALLCGRQEARLSDLWVLRYMWDRDEQIEVLHALVQETVTRDDTSVAGGAHPRAAGGDRPDAEALARSLTWLEDQLPQSANPPNSRTYLQDRLAVLEGRIQWVAAPDAREFLEKKVKGLWEKLKTEG